MGNAVLCYRPDVAKRGDEFPAATWGIGFPRDCGPEKKVPGQWNFDASSSGVGKTNFEFKISRASRQMVAADR